VPGRSFVFRIVDVKRYDELPRAEKRSWSSACDRGDFVLAEWCSIVGDDDGIVSADGVEGVSPRLKGANEVVLRDCRSWYPAEFIKDVAVVWPAEDLVNAKVAVGGMRRVFYVRFRLQGGKLLPIDGATFPTMPETDPKLGCHADGFSILLESRTSRSWLARSLLRSTVHRLLTKPRARSNSECLAGVDAEVWSIIAGALDDPAMKGSTGSKSQRGYAQATSRIALQRYNVHTRTHVVRADCDAAFKHVSTFLGNYWNVHTDTTKLKTAAMVGEREHVLAEYETVRAIIESTGPTSAPSSGAPDAATSNFEARLDELEREFHMEEPDDCGRLDPDVQPGPTDSCEERETGVSKRPSRPRAPAIPQLALKYSADLRVLSVQVCWREGPLAHFKERLEATAQRGDDAEPPAPLNSIVDGAMLPKSDSPTEPAHDKKRRKRARPNSVVIDENHPAYVAPVATFKEWETQSVLMPHRTRRQNREAT